MCNKFLILWSDTATSNGGHNRWLLAVVAVSMMMTTRSNEVLKYIRLGHWVLAFVEKIISFGVFPNRNLKLLLQLLLLSE